MTKKRYFKVHFSNGRKYDNEKIIYCCAEDDIEAYYKGRKNFSFLHPEREDLDREIYHFIHEFKNKDEAIEAYHNRMFID